MRQEHPSRGKAAEESLHQSQGRSKGPEGDEKVRGDPGGRPMFSICLAGKRNRKQGRSYKAHSTRACASEVLVKICCPIRKT